MQYLENILVDKSKINDFVLVDGESTLYKCSI